MIDTQKLDHKKKFPKSKNFLICPKLYIMIKFYVQFKATKTIWKLWGIIGAQRVNLSNRSARASLK